MERSIATSSSDIDDGADDEEDDDVAVVGVEVEPTIDGVRVAVVVEVVGREDATDIVDGGAAATLTGSSISEYADTTFDGSEAAINAGDEAGTAATGAAGGATAASGMALILVLLMVDGNDVDVGVVADVGVGAIAAACAACEGVAGGVHCGVDALITGPPNDANFGNIGTLMPIGVLSIIASLLIPLYNPAVIAAAGVVLVLRTTEGVAAGVAAAAAGTDVDRITVGMGAASINASDGSPV